jgi:rare lipoprotein A
MGICGREPGAVRAGALRVLRASAIACLAVLAAGCSAGSPAPDVPVLQYTSAEVLPEVDLAEAPALAPPAPMLTERTAIPHESIAAIAAERKGAVAKVGKPYQVMGRWYYPKHDPDYEATGIASWYGPDFHGRRTANGEIYNMQRLSGAHPTLPLPSYVEVTNLANGRTLVVRINDRGPYKRGRIIDLSKRAAELLGYTKSGTAQVRVRYLKEAPLSADVSFEERFLERQPWHRPRVAGTAPAEQGSEADWTATTTPLMPDTASPPEGTWSTASETALAVAAPEPVPAARPVAATAKNGR